MNEWQDRELGEFADVQTGPFGSQLHASDYVHSGIPSIMPTNIGSRLEINTESIVYISESDASRLSKYLVYEEDIVYSRRGDVKKCAYISKPQNGWLCGTGCLRVRFTDTKQILSKFCAYYLSTDESKGWISNHAVGTTMPNLNSSILKRVPILLPPLPEQKAIAGVLSSLDDKFDLLHRQNKILEAMAETLFRQWFIEEADESWEEVPLSVFADNIRNNVKGDELWIYDNYVGLEHIPRKRIYLDSWGSTLSISSNKSEFKRGDILFGKLRSYFHKVVFSPIDGICSTDILVIRPKMEDFFAFCLFWFFSNEVVSHSDAGAEGTRMPRTNWEIVSIILFLSHQLKGLESLMKS